MSSSPQQVHSATASSESTGPESKRKRILTISLVVGAGLLLIALFSLLGPTSRQFDQPLVYYSVKTADLDITITERGNLESQQKIDIECKVENLGGDRSGNSGTQILFIVPNGSSVKEGELLAELDSAPIKERLDSQLLATEKARAEKIQADVKYENQITQNETQLAEAKLKVQLADLDLQNYEDEAGGTFQIDVQTIELEIQQQRATQVIQNTELIGMERLFKLGYKSKGELDAARLSKMGTDRNLANSVAKRKELEKYQYRMEKLKRGGALETARRSLIQVERDNHALLAQAKATKDAADRSLVKEEERHEHYAKQLNFCKIYAPKDGMVTYATPTRYSRTGEVREGAFVRQRQKLLSLPSLRRMQVKTAVHESVLDQVRNGLRATVRIDAFPNRRYKARVAKVAVLPDRGGWLSSDTKVYSTLVTIEEDVEQLKPGMTAIVEIHVDRLQDVVSVPVQSVVEVDGENWVYVDENRRVNRRKISLGRTNDKFVEVQKGLDQGEQVVLNPMSIIDEARDKKVDDEPEAEDDYFDQMKEMDEEPQPKTKKGGGGGKKKKRAPKTKTGD